METMPSSPDEELAPSQAASPKLGDFSNVFRLCLQGSTETETAPDICLQNTPEKKTTASEVTLKMCKIPPSPPFTPSPHLSTLRYIGGLLNGLNLSSIHQASPQEAQPRDNSPIYDIEALDELKSVSSLYESVQYITPDSTPPSATGGLLDLGNAPMPEACQSPFAFVAVEDELGRNFGTMTVAAGFPAHLLDGARFYPFIPRGGADSNYVSPRYISDKASKMALLEARLFHQFEADASVRSEHGISDTSSVHIFVDLSNIIIGFYDRLKMDRNIPVQKKMRAPTFFFEAFARVLERGRPVARKVIAGSTIDNTNRNKWPNYMRDAEALGYELNILNRVTKSSPPKRRSRRFNSTGTGWATSDANTSDDTIPTAQTRRGEQGVDEILHLKMCHSFLDHSASTMVLATGDAAQAEFSDGFLKHVERALSLGWCVEVLAWRNGISSSWRSLQRKSKWSGRFQIIELDFVVEELLGAFLDY